MNWIWFWINCSRQHFFHFLLRKRLTSERQKGKFIIYDHLIFFFLFPLVSLIAMEPHKLPHCHQLHSLELQSQDITTVQRFKEKAIVHPGRFWTSFSLQMSQIKQPLERVISGKTVGRHTDITNKVIYLDENFWDYQRINLKPQYLIKDGRKITEWLKHKFGFTCWLPLTRSKVLSKSLNCPTP